MHHVSAVCMQITSRGWRKPEVSKTGSDKRGQESKPKRALSLMHSCTSHQSLVLLLRSINGHQYVERETRLLGNTTLSIKAFHILNNKIRKNS